MVEVLVALAALAVIAAVALLTVPERVWAVFGEADLGPADLHTLHRRRTPNDALAAPAGYERAEVLRPEIESPVFDVAPGELYRVVGTLIDADPASERVGDDRDALQARWVFRTPRMRYPDTLDVKVIPAGVGRSTLIIYGRARIGLRDFGTNRRRIEGLLAALSTRAPRVERR